MILINKSYKSKCGGRCSKHGAGSSSWSPRAWAYSLELESLSHTSSSIDNPSEKHRSSSIVFSQNSFEWYRNTIFIIFHKIIQKSSRNHSSFIYEDEVEKMPLTKLSYSFFTLNFIKQNSYSSLNCSFSIILSSSVSSYSICVNDLPSSSLIITNSHV